MTAGLRITVEDLETGDKETRELVPEGDYVLICVEPCHVAHTQVHPTTGTHVITIKECKRA